MVYTPLLKSEVDREQRSDGRGSSIVPPACPVWELQCSFTLHLESFFFSYVPK